MDLPPLGRCFTWFKADGSAMSRLDRILLSEEWLQEWPNPIQWDLNRDVSDHCLIILRYNSVNWGPKPFLIQQLLAATGWFFRYGKTKLKQLKTFLKSWNKDSFGDLGKELGSLTESIGVLDKKSETTQLSELEILSTRDLFEELWNKLKMKESLLYQKSRVKWIREGDANTGFFHACINGRRRRNRINALFDDSQWVETVEGIRLAIKNHFLVG